MSKPAVRIGILGFGYLGQNLAERILREGASQGAGERALELCFVWARDARKVSANPLIPASIIAADIDACVAAGADLVVEVCHPAVVAAFAGRLLAGGADVLVGSPTALADASLEAALRVLAPAGGARRLLFPAGALWASGDIARLGAAGKVAKLTLEMHKHPSSLAGLSGPPGAALARWLCDGGVGKCYLYDGPVRALAHCAPNNVNTMAAAALSVPGLGFDGVRGILVADSSLTSHIVISELEGLRDAAGECLSVRTVRTAPALPGAVTSTATLGSFWASLKAAAEGQGSLGGVILC